MNDVKSASVEQSKVANKNSNMKYKQSRERETNGETEKNTQNIKNI